MNITHKQAINFLMKDGDLAVPCSRYGRNSSDCAEVAYEVAKNYSTETGDYLTYELLDYFMGLVVNDHDDVAEWIQVEEDSNEFLDMAVAHDKLIRGQA